MSQNIQIGIRIRALRKQRRWSQERLAEESGLSLDAIGKIERGESSPTLDSLKQIADAFLLSLSEILRIDDADENRAKLMATLAGAMAKLDDRTLAVAVKQVEHLSALSRPRKS